MADDVVAEVELPLDGAGTRLVRAREAAGRTRAELAAQTRISDRQLAAIETGDYAALPSRAYAVGFARTYAKAVGLDPEAIVAQVREELAEQAPVEPRRPAQVFEPGDPARLPGGKIAWLAAIGVVGVLIAGFLTWPSLYSPGGTLPSILPAESASPAPSAPPAVAPSPATAGPVVFTATRDKVWVRFADASGTQLLQKELALGESWTVPAGVAGVTLTTARPDGLAVTIGGQAVPPLATTEQVLRDVPVTAEALLARGTASAAMIAPAASAAVASAGSAPRPTARSANPRPTESVETPSAEPVASPQPLPPAPAPATSAAAAGTADS